MSTKQTLNIVTTGRSGTQSLTNPDGSAWDPEDPPGNFNPTLMILRTRPCGAQRFASYDPVNPPTETVPLPG